VAWGAGGALAIVAALAGFAGGGLWRPWLAYLAGIAAVSVTLVALQAAFALGWWLDATTVLLALLLGLTAGSTLRFLDTRDRAANLARYQSPRLVEAIASRSDPLGNRAPQDVVVLFVDVVGFTARAERMGPAETARFLRSFHEQAEAAAEPLGGTIMDFAGDGVLVVFGLPDSATGDATRALNFVERLFRDAADNGIGLRAGGHAGPVQFSLLGGRRHKTVAISGDVVNTASRLQDLAKTQRAQLALSDDLISREETAREWAGKAGLRALKDQPLRGKSETQTIWIGSAPSPDR
jgi:adenylate cyclase